MNTELSIIIPAYNEEKRIITTLNSCIQYLDTQNKTYEIIVVDDGSKDNTIETVEKLGLDTIKIIPLKYNKGKGHAVKIGMQNANGIYRVFMDADGSTPIKELNKLLEPLIGLKADISIGSRYLADSEVMLAQPKYRILFSRMSNKIVRKILLPNIHDPHCGFKAYTSEASFLVFKFSSVSGWSFDEENLALARLFDFKIVEIPVKWMNDSESKGKISHIPKEILNLLRIKIKILVLKFFIPRTYVNFN